MIVAYSEEIRKYTDGGTVTALGSFDALHKGHTAIIKKAAEMARHDGCSLMVQFFRIPPGGYNKDGVLECVNTPERRLSILESLGVDIVVEEEFTEEFRRTDYKRFVTEYICERYNAKAVCAGYNYRFGRRAEGDAEKLRKECSALNIEVFIQDCIALDGEISSSEIRKLIKSGKMEKAAEYMGRRYAVQGTVIHGRQVGRTYGFPTANINMPKGVVIPQPGVYITEVCIDGKRFKGITNVGSKPTFSVKEANIETHIIGYDGNLYGENIELEFCKKLRDICEFKNKEELKKQLEADKLEAGR